MRLGGGAGCLGLFGGGYGRELFGPGVGRPGWLGVVFATAGGLVTLAGPVPGEHQTAQRAECWALLQALCGREGMIKVVTDSAYVCGMVSALFECCAHVRWADWVREAYVATSGDSAVPGRPEAGAWGRDAAGPEVPGRFGPYGDQFHTVRAPRGSSARLTLLGLLMWLLRSGRRRRRWPGWTRGS